MSLLFKPWIEPRIFLKVSFHCINQGIFSTHRLLYFKKFFDPGIINTWESIDQLRVSIMKLNNHLFSNILPQRVVKPASNIEPLKSSVVLPRSHNQPKFSTFKAARNYFVLTFKLQTALHPRFE